MASSCPVTTYIIGDRLPWPDDVPVPSGAGAFDEGAIYDEHARQPCAIRRISARGATVRAELRKPRGERVALELGTGQRAAATIDWSRGGEAGLEFRQPIDMLALINRSLINQPAERRRMPRIELRRPIYLRWAGLVEQATLRNISASGLQVEGDSLPARGTLVTPLIDGLVLSAGEVVWGKGGVAGIELIDELRWTSLMPWIRGIMRESLH